MALLYTTLIFGYVFAFPLFSSFIDSSYLCLAVLLILLFIFPEFRQQAKWFFNQKSTYKIYLSFFAVFSWALITQLLNTVIRKTDFDLSFIVTYIHFCLCISIGLLLIQFLISKNKKDYLVNYLICAFLIQTAIQWICFLFPDIYEITLPFRNTAGDIYNRYGGIRGLAIASSQAFALSATYGLVVILFFSEKNTLFENHIFLRLFALLFLCTGIFFSGRTGYVGLGIGIFAEGCKIIKKNEFRLSKKKILIFTAIIFILILFCFMIISMRDSAVLGAVYRYTFEMLINLIQGRGLTSSSTNSMFKMYNINYSASTLFIGDGQYEMNGGGYYQGTDIGYLRQFLYFGIPGLLLLFISQIQLLSKKSYYSFAILLYILVLQLKGEIMGFAIMFNCALLFYSYAKE